MYKNRLQEMCQQRGWALPAYTVSRDGSDHNPRFGASVAVNGLSFDAPDLSTSSKVAQGKAASAAIKHFSCLPPSAPSIQCSSTPLGNNSMYKSQLEEICRQRRYLSPEYNVIREGPDHNPRFGATVTVNGASFGAPDLSRSLKEAQGKAAEVAVKHFALMTPPKLSPPATLSSSSGNQISYKSQLQIYVQKKNINPPKYDIERHGFAPTLRFKATVTVGEQTFDSPHFFSTLREAEHDAAKVALQSLALEENLQEETLFNKSLLQELLQKEGLPLPKYNTVRDGASHMPIFSSVVEIEGETFVGDIARSKKQAEMNAAKVAWCQLKERFNAHSGRDFGLPPGFSTGFSVEEHSGPASLQLNSLAIKNLEQGESLPVPKSYDKINEGSTGKSHEDRNGVKDDSSTLPVATILNDHGTLSCNEFMGNGIEHSNGLEISHCTSDFEGATKKELPVEDILSEVGSSSSFTPSDSSDCSIEDMTSEIPEGRTTSSLLISEGRTTSSLLSTRVMVYPHKPDMVLPEGATLLPFSDDTWVAVILDYSNHKDIELKDRIMHENDSSSVNKVAICEDDQVEHASKEITVNVNDWIDNSVPTEEEDDDAETLSATKFSDHPTTDVGSEFLASKTPCSLRCNRVQVYPRKPGMVLPKGASILPFSDDTWVAVSVGCSNHAGSVADVIFN